MHSTVWNRLGTKLSRNTDKLGGKAVMDVKKAAAETKDYIVSIRRELVYRLLG